MTADTDIACRLWKLPEQQRPRLSPQQTQQQKEHILTQ